MSCYHPIKGWRGAGGKLTQTPSKALSALRLVVPCGQCIGCRLERSRQWAVRIMHEAKMHPHPKGGYRNSFLTLTYSDENLPEHNSLQKEDFQKFIRAMRDSGQKVRYFHCGEYGPETHRPHYHAAMFGVDYPDQQYKRKNKHDQKIYTSETLSDYWPHGSHEIGSLTWQSAAYIARYITSKQTGAAGEFTYGARVNKQTGEYFGTRTPPYCTMSLKPGIGKSFI